MSAIDDVREMLGEAGRLEAEATDLRIDALVLIATKGLCPDPAPSRPCVLLGGRCCVDPDDCTGRVWA